MLYGIIGAVVGLIALIVIIVVIIVLLKRNKGNDVKEDETPPGDEFPEETVIGSAVVEGNTMANPLYTNGMFDSEDSISELEADDDDVAFDVHVDPETVEINL